MAWTTALVLVLGISAAFGAHDQSFISRLGDHVKSHSDPDVAPMINKDTPVQVTFVFALLNIADVDKEHNTVTTETYVRSLWNTGVTWDPAAFGGIKSVALPAKYFWTPHMQPISTAVEFTDLSPHIVVVNSTGDAYYNQFYHVASLCDVSNVATGATCHGNNTLWGYNKAQVNIAAIQQDNTGTFSYFEGSKYEITGFGLEFHEVLFDGLTYQIIDTTMNIKEKPQPHPVNFHFVWH